MRSKPIQQTTERCTIREEQMPHCAPSVCDHWLGNIAPPNQQEIFKGFSYRWCWCHLWTATATFLWCWLQVVFILGQHQRFCSIKGFAVGYRRSCSELQMSCNISICLFTLNFAVAVRNGLFWYFQLTSSRRLQNPAADINFAAWHGVFAVDVSPMFNTRRATSYYSSYSHLVLKPVAVCN